jgi:hypothetical protein
MRRGGDEVANHGLTRVFVSVKPRRLKFPASPGAGRRQMLRASGIAQLGVPAASCCELKALVDKRLR